MPAQNKTKKLKLNQWQENEYPKMRDFNEDNSKIDEAFENLEETVQQGISNLDISEKEIKLIEEAPEELPTGNETLGVILSKFKKFLQKLHVEARTYAKTNTTNTFDGVQVFNNTIRSTTSDSSLEVRTIQGPTANGQDGNLYLNVYDPSKTVHFTTPDGVYHTLQELFQSSVDGKTTHINAINRLYGSDTGLNVYNTHADIAWWWENKVIPSKIEKEIIVKKIEVNHVSHAGTNFTSGISKILFISQEFKETKRGTHFFSTVNFVPFENGVSVYPYSHHSFFLTATTHDLNDHNVLNLRPSDWESGTYNFDLFLIGIKKQ